MLKAQKVKGPPAEAQSCAAQPCSEAFTPSRDTTRDEARPEHLCLGQEPPEGQDKGAGSSGKDPIVFALCARSSQETCLALSVPTTPHF